jgi:hypothetical protein
MNLVNEIQEKGADLQSLNDHIDTTTPHGKLTSTSLLPWLNSSKISFANGPGPDWPPLAPGAAKGDDHLVSLRKHSIQPLSPSSYTRAGGQDQRRHSPISLTPARKALTAPNSKYPRVQNRY